MPHRVLAACAAAALLAPPVPAHADAPSLPAADADADAPRAPAPAPLSPPPAPADGDGLLIGGASIGIGALALGAGAVAWWRAYRFDGFGLKNTGSFGRTTYAGGGDKAGHFVSNYIALHAMTSIYEGLGARRERAVLYAAVFTGLIAQGVEIIDGFVPVHRFEYGDVIANIVGLGLGIGTEIVPDLDRVIGARIGYWPSADFLANQRKRTAVDTYLKLINDYSGQTVFVDLKLKGALELAGVSPGPARYVLAGINWSTAKYAPKGPEEERQRNLGVHVGVALPEVIDELELGAAGRVLSGFLRYYAPPFATVSIARDLNHDRWLWSFGLASRLNIPAG